MSGEEQDVFKAFIKQRGAALHLVQEAAIVECLHEVYRLDRFKLGNSNDIATWIVTQDSKIPHKTARNCVEGKFVKKTIRSRIAAQAVILLREKREELRQAYADKKQTLAYIEQILSEKARAIDIAFANWGHPAPFNNKATETGVYQLFRRYKPPRDLVSQRTPQGEHDWTKDANHVVICELLYLNYQTMEALLITSELHVYYGSLYVNEERQLYALLQRTNVKHRGIHQRYISVRLEDAALPISAGIVVKTGDTTRRPVAAEFFFVSVPVKTHPELIPEMHALYERVRKHGQTDFLIEPESIFADYITGNQPVTPYSKDALEWARVKFVSDFDALAAMVQPDADGIKLFREPSRPVSFDQLVNISRRHPTLTVFRWNKYSSKGK